MGFDPQFEEARELTLDDLGGLPAPAPNRVERLRDSHHALARVLASGLAISEASAITGYSIPRIHRLLEAPAFEELVAFYAARGQAAVANLTDRMSILGHSAAAELQERLDETPDKFSNQGLLKVLEVTADRTGHGVRSTQVNINLDLEARLDAARRRAGLVVEHDPRTDTIPASRTDTTHNSGTDTG